MSICRLFCQYVNKLPKYLKMVLCYAIFGHLLSVLMQYPHSTYSDALHRRDFLLTKYKILYFLCVNMEEFVPDKISQ